jgi:uncharacterized protein
MRRFLIPLFLFCAVLTSSAAIGIAAMPQDPQEVSEIFDGPKIEVPQMYASHDEDRDGINDTQDLIDGARSEVVRQPEYKSAYYDGGYPPDEEGVCTDVVWRAFKHAGYDLKKLVDEDIARRTNAYPRVDGKPDPNIDFRRVPNLDVFFKKYATSLTLEVKPGDIENLTEWQGGDLVLFGGPKFHIGIVSDKRRRDGVPLLIHNAGFAREDDGLVYWPERITPIIGHYRWGK